MQGLIDAYLKISDIYDHKLLDACNELDRLSKIPFGQSGPLWLPLLGEVRADHKATLANPLSAGAVWAFQEAPTPDLAQNLCEQLTLSMIDFSKWFTQEHLAEPEAPWEAVRDYYGNPANGDTTSRYNSLKAVYDAVDKLLTAMKEIVVLMLDWRDFARCELLTSLEVHVAFGAQSVGRQFNAACSKITQGAPAVRTAPSTGITTPVQGQAQHGASGTGTAAQQDASAALAPAPHRPPMVPVIRKARSLTRRSALERLLGGAPKILEKDHAEEIANAIEYNTMTVRLLLMRIHMDLVDPRGSVVQLLDESTKTSVLKPSYAPRVTDLQTRLREDLKAAHDLLDAFRAFGNVIGNGRNFATLRAVGEAAEDVNRRLRAMGELIDTDFAGATSLSPVQDALRLQATPAGLPQWRDLSKEFDQFYSRSQVTGKKCRNIVNRINQVIADKGFSRKGLAFQSIKRITLYEVEQPLLRVQCMTTVDTALIEGRKQLNKLKPKQP
ncbi:hypothetical protein ACTVZO_38615 [Streptomyces sp. IBSNAI002]|uniref:hypothetical protein n=1 Tax=Streptomyces sp. IBSNAI002 TaxID=3457500 RepID=UPI003FD3D851